MNCILKSSLATNRNFCFCFLFLFLFFVFGLFCFLFFCFCWSFCIKLIHSLHDHRRVPAAVEGHGAVAVIANPGRYPPLGHLSVAQLLVMTVVNIAAHTVVATARPTDVGAAVVADTLVAAVVAGTRLSQPQVSATLSCTAVVAVRPHIGVPGVVVVGQECCLVTGVVVLTPLVSTPPLVGTQDDLAGVLLERSHHLRHHQGEPVVGQHGQRTGLAVQAILKDTHRLGDTADNLAVGMGRGRQLVFAESHLETVQDVPPVMAQRNVVAGLEQDVSLGDALIAESELSVGHDLSWVVDTIPVVISVEAGVLDTLGTQDARVGDEVEVSRLAADMAVAH